MHFAIIAFGSRGDVQPHIALGTRLHEAGHDVRIITHAVFETQVRQLGLHFFPAVGNPQAIVSTETGQDWLGSGNNSLLFFQRFSRIAQPLIQQAMLDCWQGCQNTDAIVCSPLAICTAPSIAEKLRIPYWIGAGQPLTPTTAFASPFFPAAPLPFSWLRNRYNQQTHTLSARIFWRLIGPIVNTARQTVLHLPPLDGNWLYENVVKQRFNILYYYSPSVLPQPSDWLQHNNHVTGYWFLDHTTNWQPSNSLLDFLASGPAPVYIGFGSMQTRDPDQMTKTVLKALRISGQRGILLTAPGSLSHTNLPDEVFQLEFAPHDWLFPRMVAVVHHGGAGTMAASLRASIPSIMIPFFGDQPFWGRRFSAMGIIPAPIPRKHLSAERLAAAINIAVNDTAMRSRVTALSASIRAEDGLQQAVSILQQQTSGDARGRAP